METNYEQAVKDGRMVIREEPTGEYYLRHVDDNGRYDYAINPDDRSIRFANAGLAKYCAKANNYDNYKILPVTETKYYPVWNDDGNYLV